MKIRHFPLLTLIVMTAACEARAQAGIAAPEQPTRTLAALLAEGYEMQELRLFKDKIWMRKPGGIIAYVCDRGRIGSDAFEAYRKGNYDEVSCLPTPP